MHSLDFDKIEILSKNLNIEPYQLFLQTKHNITLPRRIDMVEK